MIASGVQLSCQSIHHLMQFRFERSRGICGKPLKIQPRFELGINAIYVSLLACISLVFCRFIHLLVDQLRVSGGFLSID